MNVNICMKFHRDGGEVRVLKFGFSALIQFWEGCIIKELVFLWNVEYASSDQSINHIFIYITATHFQTHTSRTNLNQ